MSGDFKVSFGALDTAAADIAASGKALQSRLDDLDRSLAPLRSDWTGEASESYQRSRAQWTQAISDMNTLLGDIGRAVGQSSSGFSGSEKSNSGRFQG